MEPNQNYPHAQGPSGPLRNPLQNSQPPVPHFIEVPSIQVPQTQTFSATQMFPMMNRGNNSNEEENADIDLRDYLGVILHRRYWLVVTVVISLITGFFAKIDFDPKYSANSRLRIISMTGVMDPWYGYDYISDNVLTTHMENLKSTSFLKQVQKNLDTSLSTGDISGSFSVSRTKEANIINITVTTRNPDLSAKLANTLAMTYDKFDLAIKQKSFREYENWIKNEMSQRKEMLDKIESELKVFFEENPEFYSKAKSSDVKFSLYDKEITDLNLQISDLNRQFYLVENELKSVDSTVIRDLEYDQPLKKELMSLKLEHAKLITKYQPNHPKVLELAKKMKAVQNLIQQDAANESNTTTMANNPRYEELKNKQREVKIQRDLFNTKQQELYKLQSQGLKNLALAPDLELRFNQLTRSKQSTEKMYFMLEEKLQETQLKKSATPREVFFMDGQNGPGNLIGKSSLGLLASLLVGIALGCILCFAVDFFDTTVRKSKDMESKYGINMLALIPKSEEESRQITLTSENELMKPQFEPYRRLLANLFPPTEQYHSTNRSILVTSALQGEGKTTTAAYLAATAAMRGERVLIVDADLRRHNLHHILGLKNDFGLSDYLNSDIPLSQVIKDTNLPSLKVICAGQDPLSLTQSYAKKKINNLIQEANENFDLLILDSPPILQLTDTLTIAPFISKTLVVFRSKKTPLKAGEEVVRQLTHINAKIAGGVLNDVSRTFWDQYYYQYYKYGYKYAYY